MVPTQPAARSSASAAAGLSMVMTFSGLTMVPPVLE